PGEIQDAHDVLDFANERGIGFAGVPMNDGPTVARGILNDGSYQKFVNKLLERHRQGYPFAGPLGFNQRLYKGAPFNCRNTVKPHVDFDGRLFWPCKACVNTKPVMIDVLKFKHIDEVWAHGRTLISPDKFHGPGS